MSLQEGMGDIHRECWESLPWLVNERLSVRDTARLTRHLQECAACQVELETQQRLRDAIRSDDSLVLAPQAGLQQLMQRIEAEERPATTEPAAIETPLSAVRTKPIARPSWLAIAAAVQTVVIGTLLGWQMYEGLQAPVYVTRTEPSLANGSVLRVVFADTSSVGEVRDLLQRIDAHIVDGPSKAGVYTLALGTSSTRADPETALATLRADSGVVFAEEAIAEVDRR
jgi:anti-sigma factor RsiW